MDVSEIVARRTEAEKQINQILRNFGKETGVLVEIETRRYQEIGQPPRSEIQLVTILP